MKMRELTATTRACGFFCAGFTIFCAGFTIFTEKANAGATATSTVTFNATVVPSCAVTTPFSSVPAAGNYVQTGTGAAGGKTQLSRSKTAQFDCNSDTVAVSAVVTLTQPNVVNATAIVGTHKVTIDDSVFGDVAILQNGAGTFTSTARTDTSGDIGFVVTSTWTSTGEDLLTGNYVANIAVSVTAN
jgi:hypothetical protein